MGAEGILSKETGAGVGLVMGGGILSKEADDGEGADAGLGWVLVADGVENELVTREEGVLLGSIILEVTTGLETATDTEPEVVNDTGTVILAEKTGAGDEGLIVTVEAGGTVTGAFASPAAELGEALLVVEVCRFKLVAESGLVGGGWVKATGVGGLCFTGGGLADTGGGSTTGLGLLTEGVTGGGAVISVANLLAVEVRVELIEEGALTTVAGVFGGTVVGAEVELVDFIVIIEEDVIGEERLAKVTGVVESCVAVGAGVDLILLLAEAAVESELNLTDGVVRVEDLVSVVMMVLGLATGEEAAVVVLARGVKY